MSPKRSVGERPLRAGDVVEVKSAAEILPTLGSDASIDAMPFMPEMLQFAGKRFTVSHRVEKICDTVSGGAPNSRRMRDTVLLEDLRCDGSGHGGCQAGCRLYWKESWVRRVGPGGESDGPVGVADEGDGGAQLEELARVGATALRDLDGARVESYRCQATEAVRATKPLSSYDPRQYMRELSSGNVELPRFLQVSARALRGLIGRRLRLLSYRPLQQGALAAPIYRRLGLHGRPPLPQGDEVVPARGELYLRPGDTVEVRSPAEIATTVDARGHNRGLSFDWEMLPYCGGRYRVRDRVERIIDERTGQMIELRSDCLILDGVVCSGEHSRGRRFCRRAIYAYWREAWLRPVDDAETDSIDAVHS